ncbi:MAG: IS1380 family transposase, partial [Candidatus Dormibacteria bacterium]
MQVSHTLDRLHVAFDDQHLVAHAGLLLPATLAQHLGVRDLIDEFVDLGEVAGAANAGEKAMTVISSVLAGGDCIDDVDALRSGGCAAVLGHRVAAPSTVGTFLRAFRWGHVRQLDAVSRELLARAWAGGAGPGSGPLTMDVDSTICETYGLLKQGASRFTYTQVRGYHPLLAVAAGTGDVLHSRLRGGSANTVRGAASFVAETVSRVRAAGVTGDLVLRADAGFFTGKVVRTCRQHGVRLSITVRLSRTLHRVISEIPEDAWIPIPYFLDGADVAETTYTPFRGRDAKPVRLIVRRVRPTPGSQLALEGIL